MEFNGVPLHPLIVHAVVIFGPLAALTGVVYALVPRWRWLLRWPLVVLALVTAGAAVLAAQAGESLLHARPELEPIIEEHEEAGELLRTVSIGFAVISLFGAWALGGVSALASGRGARESRLAIPAALLLIVGAVVLGYTLFQAGHSGAEAVWG